MKKTHLIVLFIVIALLAGASNAMAEPAVSDEALYQQIQELKTLKEKDPEAFRKRIEEKRTFVHNEFSRIKSEDPSAGRFFQREQKFRQQRLNGFRKNHPQMFREFQGGRKRALNRVRSEDPEGFQKFPGKHPAFRERLAESENGNPQQHFQRPQNNSTGDDWKNKRPFRRSRPSARRMRSGQ